MIVGTVEGGTIRSERYLDGQVLRKFGQA